MIGADRHPAGVRGDVVDAVRLAHVIRYLDDAHAIDTDTQAWARQVADALRRAIHEVNTTRVDDQATPDAGPLTRLRRRYDQGVAVGMVPAELAGRPRTGRARPHLPRSPRPLRVSPARP